MITIHIIDGDAAVRLAVRRVLEPAGFAVTEAADEEYAAPTRPELVIADLAFASLAAIRRRHPGTPILAITGDGVAPTEAGLLAGELNKPFTPSQLLGAVRRCLVRPRATTGRRRR
jgi:DNA-binding response OmpR family regulator